MTSPREAASISGRTIALIALIVLNAVLLVLNLQKNDLFPFENSQVSINTPADITY